jgi:hypothetical protein
MRAFLVFVALLVVLSVGVLACSLVHLDHAISASSTLQADGPTIACHSYGC